MSHSDNPRMNNHRRRLLKNEFFKRRWDEITRVIDYDITWENPIAPKHIEGVTLRGMVPYTPGGATKDPVFDTLKFGEVVKSMDDYGRKFIFVKTRLGLWIFFNASKDVKRMILADWRTSRLQAYDTHPVGPSRVDLSVYIGSPNGISDDCKVTSYNVGERIELVFKMMHEPEFYQNVYHSRNSKGDPVK